MEKHSKDYIKLMRFLHEDKCVLHSIKIKLGLDESRFILKEMDKEVVFESKEPDVARLGLHLKIFPNLNYQDEFREVKDLNKYFDDIDFFIDLDKKKFQAAKNDISVANYQFKYDPVVLVEDFLHFDKKSTTAYKQLKEDYYHILIYFVHVLTQLQRTNEIKCSQNQKLKTQVDFLFKRIMKYISSATPIEAYHKLMDLVGFCPQKKMSKYVELHKEFSQTFLIIQKSYGNKTKVDNVLHLLLDIYRKLAEFSSDYIKIFSKIEHAMSGEKYNKYFGFNKDYDYLTNIPDYKQILQCLDPKIRHSESHLNTEYNRKDGKIIITKKNGRSCKVVREYSYQEFSHISYELYSTLALALTMSVSLAHIITLFSVINSKEYKMLLISIGNKK